MNNKPALFDLTILPEPSEQDLVVNIWGPVLEALFAKANIVVKWLGPTTFLLNLDSKRILTTVFFSGDTVLADVDS
ncbi:unnamed protein product [Mucor hiemalis]